MRRISLIALMSLSVYVLADDTKKAPPPKIEAFTSADKAGPDFEIQGDYSGKAIGPGVTDVAQVIALGDNKFEVVLTRIGRDDQSTLLRATTERKDGRLVVENKEFRCSIEKGRMTINDSEKGLHILEHYVRQSPNLGLKPPAGAKVLFDGSSTDHWDKGQLVEGNLLHWGTTSKAKFNDCTIHVEFRLPFMPRARGQERANSGVYVQGRYEIQVLDSFGLEGKNNECGGIYQISAPKVNMCYPPLSWQTYDIDFTAARFDSASKKTADAMLTVRHNGVVIQDQVKLPNPTGGSLTKESAEPGPIYLQDHGDPVVFRNIWVLPKK